MSQIAKQIITGFVLTILWIWACAYGMHALAPDDWMRQWYAIPLVMSLVFGGFACYGSGAWFPYKDAP